MLLGEDIPLISQRKLSVFLFLPIRLFEEDNNTELIKANPQMIAGGLVKETSFVRQQRPFTLRNELGHFLSFFMGIIQKEKKVGNGQLLQQY